MPEHKTTHQPAFSALIKSGIIVVFCYLLAAAFSNTISRGVYGAGYSAIAAVKGDNRGYLELTGNIVAGRADFPLTPRTPRLYPGLPVLSGAIARVFALQATRAMTLICWAAALCAWLLTCRLYGPLAGALFMCANYSLMERFLYGGPEAPAICFGLAGLLVARKDSSRSLLLASSLFGLAIAVRPHAVFFALALWMVLAVRRRFSLLAASILITSCVPLACLALFRLRNVPWDAGGYRMDWYGSSPVSFPIWPLLYTVLTIDEPWSAMAKQLAYVCIVLAGAWITLRHWRSFMATMPIETVGFLLSALFLFSYNSDWGLAEFARFAVFCFPWACYVIVKASEMDERRLWRIVTLICVGGAFVWPLSWNGLSPSLAFLRTLVNAQ